MIFTAIFAAEAVILVSGLGWRLYLNDRWNVLSLLIVVFAVVSLAVQSWGTGPDTTLTADVFFPIRVLRVVRIVQWMPGVLALTRTVMHTISQLLNVMLLMFIMYYIFAIVGMFYFGKVCASYLTYRLPVHVFLSGQAFLSIFLRQYCRCLLPSVHLFLSGQVSSLFLLEPFGTSAAQVDIQHSLSLYDHINFQDFGSSLLTCYVMSTGENCMRTSQLSFLAGNLLWTYM